MNQCSKCGGPAHRTKRCPYGKGYRPTKAITRDLVHACDAVLMLYGSQYGTTERLERVRILCMELRNNGLFYE